MKVFFVIPTRNRKDLLTKCLKSISKQKYKNIEVFVIDDGSTDGTRELLDSDYKMVKVIEGDGNLWWTGAMRKGVEYVLSVANSSDFILIQNDDTHMNSDYVEILVDESEANNRCIVGTSVVDYKTNKLLYNSHGLVNGSFRPIILNSENTLLPTETLSGRGVLIPIEVFKKIGNFSKLFPQYAADYDFFCRAKKNGFILRVSTKAITYSTNVKPNLSKRIKQKEKLSLKDIYDLFFSRRSSNNLWSSTMITLLHAPLGLKFYGVFRIYLYALKVLFVDWGLKGIKFLLKKR